VLENQTRQEAHVGGGEGLHQPEGHPRLTRLLVDGCPGTQDLLPIMKSLSTSPCGPDCVWSPPWGDFGVPAWKLLLRDVCMYVQCLSVNHSFSEPCKDLNQMGGPVRGHSRAQPCAVMREHCAPGPAPSAAPQS
jgi:hypothetical protein